MVPMKQVENGRGDLASKPKYILHAEQERCPLLGSAVEVLQDVKCCTDSSTVERITAGERAMSHFKLDEDIGNVSHVIYTTRCSLLSASR